MRISISIKKISCKISQILKRMHEADGFSAKTLGESLFQFQNNWSGRVPAGQFCLLESVYDCNHHNTVLKLPLQPVPTS